MKDYLITVEKISQFDSGSVHSIRITDKSEDFIGGMVEGLKIAYPKNEVYKQEIKKLEK